MYQVKNIDKIKSPLVKQYLKQGNIISSADDFEIEILREQEMTIEMNIKTQEAINSAIFEEFGVISRFGHMYRHTKTTSRLIRSGIRASRFSKHHEWGAGDIYFYDAKTDERIRDIRLFNRIARFIKKNFGFALIEIIVYSWGIHKGYINVTDIIMDRRIKYREVKIKEK